MRDVARSARRSKAAREQLLKESAKGFLDKYAELKALVSDRAAGPQAKTDQDFVAQHRAELGQKALDAARAFVEEHKWKMRSEWGRSATSCAKGY